MVSRSSSTDRSIKLLLLEFVSLSMKNPLPSESMENVRMLCTDPVGEIPPHRRPPRSPTDDEAHSLGLGGRDDGALLMENSDDIDGFGLGRAMLGSIRGRDCLGDMLSLGPGGREGITNC